MTCMCTQVCYIYVYVKVIRDKTKVFVIKEGKENQEFQGWQFAVFRRVIKEGLTEVTFEQRPEGAQGRRACVHLGERRSAETE